nr:hypothetical protein [Streptomyces sp. DSM 41633]
MSAEPGGPRPATGFPDDLVALEQQWTRIFTRLAADPPADGHEIRRELLGLSLRLDAHPHRATTEAGWSRAARRALQHYPGAAPGGRGAAGHAMRGRPHHRGPARRGRVPAVKNALMRPGVDACRDCAAAEVLGQWRRTGAVRAGGLSRACDSRRTAS